MKRWTQSSLSQLIADRLRGIRLIVVSNREPYLHVRRNGGIECITPASGLTTAVDPILRASGGLWVAHGSGNADWEVANRRGQVSVPPDRPRYTLRRVRLSPQVEKEYYYGLSNEGLWPLCHIAFQKPRYVPRHWQSYRRANEIFARVVLEEAAGEPAIVFVQDYHLALLPRMLQQANPALTVAQFWHIPWPNRETFRTFPWKEELLDGLLGNDLLGFHIRYHCSNFLDTVDRSIEALVEMEHARVIRGGHQTLVRPYPISIDFAAHVERAMSAEVAAAGERLLEELGPLPEFVGIGIDRIDYTKGIPNRFHALNHLFETHPEYIGNLTFLQVGAPSRTGISEYDRLGDELVAQVAELNARWGRRTWQPLLYLPRHFGQNDLVALHLMANFCVVSSLHDGMNLVAKEFVASRLDGDGVLILSQFTGAARELTDALIVNPFAEDELAQAMHRAMTMPAAERQWRMERCRAVVESNDVYRWGGKILTTLANLAPASERATGVAAGCD